MLDYHENVVSETVKFFDISAYNFGSSKIFSMFRVGAVMGIF